MVPEGPNLAFKLGIDVYEWYLLLRGGAAPGYRHVEDHKESLPVHETWRVSSR